MPKIIWLLVVARAVNRLGAFSLPFLAVLLIQERGWSTAEVGVTMTAFGLATMPSRLAGGRLADRLGRRTTIGIGLTGCALAQLGIAATSSTIGTAVAVVGLGLCFEVYEPPSQALVADYVSPEDQPAAHGLMAAALASAGMLAGGLAVVLTHLDLRWLFVADAASCLTCAGVLVVALPRETPAAAAHQQEGPHQSSPWRDGRLLALLAVQTVFAVVYLQSVFALPLSLLRRGLPPESLGVLLTVSAATLVAAQPLMRWRRLRDAGSSALLTVGYLLLGLGMAGYALSASLTGFTAATVFAGLGDLLLMGHLITRASALAEPHLGARYLAVFGTSWGIAAVVSPTVGTGLLALTGVAGTWWSLAGVCLCLAVAERRRASRLRLRVAACQLSPPSKPAPEPRRSPSRRTTSRST